MFVVCAVLSKSHFVTCLEISNFSKPMENNRAHRIGNCLCEITNYFIKLKSDII